MTERELIEKMKAGAVFKRTSFYGVEHFALGTHIYYTLDDERVPINYVEIVTSLWLGHLIIVEEGLDHYQLFGLPE